MFGSFTAAYLLAVSLSAQYSSALELLPINDVESLGSGGAAFTKRESTGAGDWDLRSDETFRWAARSGPREAVLAVLDLKYPGANENVISMDRFAKHLEAVDCQDPDLMLDFKDDESFEAAKKHWGWVNEEEDNHFVMITDYAGCGADNTRTPYNITAVDYDEVKSIAYLTGRPVQWAEVAHSYHLTVSSMPVDPPAGLERRGDATFSIAKEFNGDWFSQEANGLTLTMGCVDCHTTGNFDFVWDLDVDWFVIDSATVTVSPRGVSASMELGVTASGSLNTAWDWDKQLFTFPIQAITIAGILNFGGFFDIDAGVSISNWTGSVEASMGAKATIDDAAILVIDLVDSDKSTVEGWEPVIEDIPFQLSAQIECEAEAYVQPALKLKAEAFKRGWEMELGMKMPYVRANAAATFDTEGVCDTDMQFGVSAALSIGVELTASASKIDDEPFWETTLFEKDFPLADVCLPFGEDGDGEEDTEETPTTTDPVPEPTPPSNSTVVRRFNAGRYDARRFDASRFDYRRSTV